MLRYGPGADGRGCAGRCALPFFMECVALVSRTEGWRGPLPLPAVGTLTAPRHGDFGGGRLSQGHQQQWSC